MPSGIVQWCCDVLKPQIPSLTSCVVLLRLVNENEVKQWKEQAEKMRKGTNTNALWFLLAMELSEGRTSCTVYHHTAD